MEKTVSDFYKDFQNELALSRENDSYNKGEDFFTNLMFEYLEEAGEVEEPILCSFHDNGTQINGFQFSDDYTSLSIFVSIFREADDLINITKSEVAAAQNRAFNTYRKSVAGKYDQFDKDSDLYGLAETIYKNKDITKNVEIIALVNGIVKDMPSTSQKTFFGTVSFNVWDFDRLYKCMTSGQEREPIIVSLTHYLGKQLPALVGGLSDKTTVYVAIIPGSFIAELYGDYHDKLLERNVRSYLQKRSPVNKGIIETIQMEPDLFLAYNNGITVTASSVDLDSTPGTNQVSIKTITDFQIVNGGQTTVSLFTARNDRSFESDFSKVFLQMKLAVVSSNSDIDEIVPNISKYSNSQNKIQTADFASNDPYHREMETLSRSIWTPAKNGKKPVQWFFERARGQYASALNAEPTPSKRREFKEYHPLLTKTDLAKVLYSWKCEPNVVSLGSQKCFGKFMSDMGVDERIVPNLPYFEHCISKTILFRAIEKIVLQQKFGGYKANIVAYTYYKLMLLTEKKIDLEKIWDNQAISDAMSSEITNLCKAIQKYLVVDNSGANISEFSKSKKCVDGVAELPYTLSDELRKELTPEEQIDETETASDTKSELTAEETEIVEKAWAVSANEWQTMALWAKENQKLTLFERSTLFAMYALKNRKHKPTPEQATAVLQIRDDLINLGFIMK